jgi:uncharacterized protein YegP (UPF0339 family)
MAQEALKQFVLYKGDAGQWRWRLYAKNRKIIADSGEGYVRKVNALHGISLVVATVADACLERYRRVVEVSL